MINVLEKDNGNRDVAGDRAKLESVIYNPLGDDWYYYRGESYWKGVYHEMDGRHILDSVYIKGDFKNYGGNMFFRYD